ncbi:MAG: primosomal protein N' [Chloroflexota bacterium]|nr:primosomal protein N' [Chloroflexota bacterium]
MESCAFVDVVVFSPARASEDCPAFTYEVPQELEGRLNVGSLVVVPFGTRRLYGVVVGVRDRSPVPETRPVESLVDPKPVLTPEQIGLARWMRDEYVASLYECLELMLPPGLVGHADLKISLKDHASEQDANTEAQAALLTVLQRRGPLQGTQLDAALRGIDWRAASQQLARRGVVDRESFLAPPRAQPKRVEIVRLIPRADEEAGLKGLRSEYYPEILDLLTSRSGPVAVHEVYEEVGCSRYHLNKLQERGLIALDRKEVWRDPLSEEAFVPTTPPRLTTDQRAVWDPVRQAVSDPQSRVLLIHGVTGSGKTEVYLRAVARVLDQGRKAIVLVPEISLTPQTVARFAGRFPDQVAVLHSALTDGERYDTWRRARAELIDVIVGPRSALFVPLSPLGLIVLDEEHDDSYKQEAPSPRYHAREAAIELARLYRATVVLGSATPSLESYHRAKGGEFQLHEMPRRIMGHTRRLQELQARHDVPSIRYRSLNDEADEGCYLPLPPVQIVDLRAELRAGNRSILSRVLQRAIDEALARGEQVILFLNRRGAATFVLCRDCGFVVRCPHCDVPMTYHSSRARLICHHCNHREPQPHRCPQCGGSRIRYFGLGTERVEQIVRESWPDARLLRWDSDTARTHAAHANILGRFAAGAADVLVGTQMITKGLDLPLVTVVGVISADTALNLPDYRSGERTFQVLTQVAGRAGRGLLGGRVFIQTYHPEHYAVTAASEHDYESFAIQELAFRREQGYPPYSRLAKLICEDTDYFRARTRAERMAEELQVALTRDGLPVGSLIGPAPPFFARLRGRYRWQILVRHPSPPALLRAIEIPAGWRVEVDPVSVL